MRVLITQNLMSQYSRIPFNVVSFFFDPTQGDLRMPMPY